MCVEHDGVVGGEAGSSSRAEALSDQLRRIARREGKEGGREGLHQRSVIRLHRLVRGCDARGSEMAQAVAAPTREGLSATVTEGLRAGAVLLAVEYELDDGGRGRQQHGDMLFWEPAGGGEDGRWVAVECKRLMGGKWVESHRGDRAAAVEAQAKRVAGRVRSWLSHLCAHDETMSRCVALRDGARSVAPATLTDEGLRLLL